jgi:hypothetical protein
MTVKIPVFKETEETEGLLFVKELFDRAARHLEQNTGDQLFDNFEQALSDLAEQHWENIVDGIRAAAHILVQFQESFDVLVLSYSHEQARG